VIRYFGPGTARATVTATKSRDHFHAQAEAIVRSDAAKCLVLA